MPISFFRSPLRERKLSVCGVGQCVSCACNDGCVIAVLGPLAMFAFIVMLKFFSVCIFKALI